MVRSHEELKELLVPYALGAIPEEEMAEIRSHILSCEECMAEADSFTDVASSLAVAARPEAVPPGFADRVLARAREDLGPSVPTTSPVLRRFRLLESLSFAALIVAVGVLSFALVDARSDAAYERRVVGALVASDEGFELTGTGASRGAVVPFDGAAVFVADGLEDAPSDRTYQLWLMEGDCSAAADCTIVSGGVFDVRDGVAIHETTRALEGFDDAAVTLERRGGSDQPTTEPLLSSF